MSKYSIAGQVKKIEVAEDCVKISLVPDYDYSTHCLEDRNKKMVLFRHPSDDKSGNESGRAEMAYYEQYVYIEIRNLATFIQVLRESNCWSESNWEFVFEPISDFKGNLTIRVKELNDEHKLVERMLNKGENALVLKKITCKL